MAFQIAKKEHLKGRIALMGGSGSGKTLSALKIAAGLGQRIAVIDTEHGKSALYAGEPGVPEFSIQTLSTYNPNNYIEAIKEAEVAGFDVVIIDSLSHAWNSTGGILEMVDGGEKFKFGNWKTATPLHNKMIDAILGSKCHIIATMRAKMDYVLEVNGQGKQVPTKVGLAPVQRNDAEFEFDIAGMLNKEHELQIVKTRMSSIDGSVFDKPGREFGETISKWLKDGVPPITKCPVSGRDERVTDLGNGTFIAQRVNPEPAAPKPTIKERLSVAWRQHKAKDKDATPDKFYTEVATGSYGGTWIPSDQLNEEQLAKLDAWLTSKGV